LTHSSEFYLAIEGIDGTGKTHVAKAISNSIGLKFIKEPSDNDIGKLIYSKSWDPRTDFFLFFADRIELLNGIKGDVVSDRSLWSTFAYQGQSFQKFLEGLIISIAFSKRFLKCCQEYLIMSSSCRAIQN
jgi:Thymidylate kinase